MIAILMISVKLITSSLAEIKNFRNKGYAIVISVSDVTSKIMVCDSTYIIDVAVGSKFCRPCISAREVIITSF